tara:strand:+ start:173 stop:532 length:360 start_codon:yes stop_codon:yes gene_type:complete
MVILGVKWVRKVNSELQFHVAGFRLRRYSLTPEESMDGALIEETIRTLFTDLKEDKVESLLVQCADWGINVRMFLNGEIVELDLLKNYEGYEVTFVEERDKETAQIDELADLIQLLKVS